MGARGFWLPQGSDPRLEPMMLHSAHGSGVLVWRSEDGRYLLEPPGGGRMTSRARKLLARRRLARLPPRSSRWRAGGCPTDRRAARVGFHGAVREAPLMTTGWPVLTGAEWAAVEQDQRSGRHYRKPDRCWCGSDHDRHIPGRLVPPPWSSSTGRKYRLNTADLAIVVNGVVLLASGGAGWDLCRRDKIRSGAGKATPEPAAPPSDGNGRRVVSDPITAPFAASLRRPPPRAQMVAAGPRRGIGRVHRHHLLG